MTVKHSGSSVSVAGDSRITPFGAVLRHYKLDELPELWDVLRGKMGFVGPRPDVPGYADKLIGDDRDVLKCKKQVFDQQFSEKLDSADFGKLVLHIVIDKAVMRQRAAASLLGA